MSFKLACNRCCSYYINEICFPTIYSADLEESYRLLYNGPESILLSEDFLKSSSNNDSVPILCRDRAGHITVCITLAWFTENGACWLTLKSLYRSHSFWYSHLSKLSLAVVTSSNTWALFYWHALFHLANKIAPWGSIFGPVSISSALIYSHGFNHQQNRFPTCTCNIHFRFSLPWSLSTIHLISSSRCLLLSDIFLKLSSFSSPD